MPAEVDIAGYEQAVPPGAAAVINGTLAPSVIDWTCTNRGTKRAGEARVRLSDPNHTNYNLYAVNQEVKLYIKNTATNTLVQVFGGVINRISYEQSNRLVLVIDATDWFGRYMQKQTSTTQTSVDIKTIVNALLGDFTDVTRTDLDTSGITISSFVPTNLSDFQALTQLVEQAGMRLWIDTAKGAHFKTTGNLVASTDSLTSSNMISIRKDQDQTELWNDVTVYGKYTGQSAEVTDSTSQTNYGVKQVAFTATTLTATADLTNAANKILANHKNPRTIYVIESKLLFDAFVGKNINVTYAPLGLSAAAQEIMEIGYSWGSGSTKCTITCGDVVPALPYQVGKLARDVSAAQITPSSQVYFPTQSVATATSSGNPPGSETTLDSITITPNGTGNYLLAVWSGASFQFTGNVGDVTLKLYIGASAVCSTYLKCATSGTQGNVPASLSGAASVTGGSAITVKVTWIGTGNAVPLTSTTRSLSATAWPYQ